MGFIESQTGLGGKGPQSPSSPNPLPRAGTPSTSPGCPKPHPTWPSTLPGSQGQPQLLWATCARASAPSQGRISASHLISISPPAASGHSPWPVTPCPCHQPLSSFPGAPAGTGRGSKVSLEPSLLQAEQPQLSQPVLIAEVLQPSDQLRGLLWTHSNN